VFILGSWCNLLLSCMCSLIARVTCQVIECNHAYDNARLLYQEFYVQIDAKRCAEYKREPMYNTAKIRSE